MSQTGFAPVDAAAAADWVRGSLSQGSDLAMFMTRRLQDLPVALVVAPSTSPLANASLDDHGRGIRGGEVDQIAEFLFDSLAQAGLKTLVVEDDLARRGDPGLPRDVAFVGERVLRWTDLGHGAVAARLLRTGSSGYPLNAIVCRPSADELTLVAGRALDDRETSALADAACAVITSVYDAETYLVLTTPELGEAGR